MMSLARPCRCGSWSRICDAVPDVGNTTGVADRLRGKNAGERAMDRIALYLFCT
jgi:hypothetical protein